MKKTGPRKASEEHSSTAVKPAISEGDRKILRELAKRYLEVCHTDRNNEKRRLWRQHNSLKPTRPLFLAMTSTHFVEDREASRLVCEDAFLKLFERDLKRRIYQAACDDDTVFEPWLVHGSTPKFPVPGGAQWGVPFEYEQVKGGTGWHIKPTIREPDDIRKLVQPPHRIDEAVTEEGRAKLEEVVGDVLPVVVDRGSMLRAFPGDISTDIGFLRGQEQMLWDMVDRPEWYHQLLALLSDGVLKNHAGCEAAGDWRFVSSDNQSMPYAEELPLLSPSTEAVPRKQLWCFLAAQEYAAVSPEMHEEFLLRYQIPIMEQFGLAAYGCCEDLTRKIDILRKVRNLRRIAVTPWANVAKCAEQIGKDYVCSWRPNPATHGCSGFDADQIRRDIRTGLAEFRKHHCHADITLKDVGTLEGHPERIRDWCRIVRECAEA
jgi:hypothetical protein